MLENGEPSSRPLGTIEIPAGGRFVLEPGAVFLKLLGLARPLVQGRGFQVRLTFAAAGEHSRAVAASHDLDEQFPWHHGPVSLRFVYVHMIAELARHAGHGDILAEQLQAEQRQDQAPG